MVLLFSPSPLSDFFFTGDVALQSDDRAISRAEPTEYKVLYSVHNHNSADQPHMAIGPTSPCLTPPLPLSFGSEFRTEGNNNNNNNIARMLGDILLSIL